MPAFAIQQRAAKYPLDRLDVGDEFVIAQKPESLLSSDLRAVTTPHA